MPVRLVRKFYKHLVFPYFGLLYLFSNNDRAAYSAIYFLLYIFLSTVYNIGSDIMQYVIIGNIIFEIFLHLLDSYSKLSRNTLIIATKSIFVKNYYFLNYNTII